MQRYRKRPVEIEAIQFTEESKDRVYAWAKSIQVGVHPSRDSEDNPALLVPTSEGIMFCAIDDYLIKEPFPMDWRKLYPCKPDIFEKTYRLIADDNARLSSLPQNMKPNSISFFRNSDDSYSLELFYENPIKDGNVKRTKGIFVKVEKVTIECAAILAEQLAK